MQFRKTNPKGTQLSPESRAIIRHLEREGDQTFEQLDELFKEPTRFRVNHKETFPPRSDWLRLKLSHLREGGYVLRKTIDGQKLYAARSSADEVEAPTAATAAVAPSGIVAQPRRIQVMGTPTYVPPKGATVREGAMQFAACPSLQSGRTVPFQPGTGASHG